MLEWFKKDGVRQGRVQNVSGNASGAQSLSVVSQWKVAAKVMHDTDGTLGAKTIKGQATTGQAIECFSPELLGTSSVLFPGYISTHIPRAWAGQAMPVHSPTYQEFPPRPVSVWGLECTPRQSGRQFRCTIPHPVLGRQCWCSPLPHAYPTYRTRVLPWRHGIQSPTTHSAT